MLGSLAGSRSRDFAIPGAGTAALRVRRPYLGWYQQTSFMLASIALGVALAVTLFVVNYTGAVEELSTVAYEARLSSGFIEAASNRFEAPPPPPPPAAPLSGNVIGRNQIVVKGTISGVNVTFYDCAVQRFCGAMYNGRRVYEGAAACSWNLAIGTKFILIGDPTNRIYTCEDRGLLANTWVDIFWYEPLDGYKWQSAVGRYGTIEIVEIP